MKRHTLLAFTLIELLVVIVIIAVLAGLAFPVFQGVQNQAKKTQAKNDVTQILTAVNAFYTEYGKYPIDPSLGSGDVFYGPAGTAPTGVTLSAENDKLFDVLRNDSVTNPSNAALVSTLNPRGIAFLNVPAAGNPANPKSGIVKGGTSNLGRWYDPWGVQYRILIDGNYDNQVQNPYADIPGGLQLNNGTIAWSFGKNGALGGGAAATGFSKEPGTANNYTSSGDVISWQ